MLTYAASVLTDDIQLYCKYYWNESESLYPYAYKVHQSPKILYNQFISKLYTSRLSWFKIFFKMYF